MSTIPMTSFKHNVRGMAELATYQKLENDIKFLTGYDIRQLKRMFAAGFTLKPPDYLPMNTIVDILLTE